MLVSQILQAKVIFPRCVERDAKSLIKHLLAHDLTKRYGCLVVRTHTFR